MEKSEKEEEEEDDRKSEDDKEVNTKSFKNGGVYNGVLEPLHCLT